ncbi:L,D-transpeptidase, partial [Enhygromyxa salina]|uniref:L,D-transpeptidase n=1 Tax=Enhygromyxa salina TaxID=215803 RepID=UPI000698B666
MLITATLFAHTLRALTGLEPGPTADEAKIEPTEVRYVEAAWPETVVRARPWVPHRRVATVSDGTRFVVRGIVQSRDDKGCSGKPWYAVYPFGFVCSEHVQTSKRGPTPGAAMQLDQDQRVPFTYAFVRTDGVPMYNGYADIDAGVPSRPLTKGMSVVVARSLEYDGAEWIQTEDGALVPKAGIRYGGQGSEWAGVELTGDHAGPSFAWTNLKKGTPVRAAPDAGAERVLELELRTRVPLLERSDTGRNTFWRVGEGLWIDAGHLNEVHLTASAPPEVLDDWRGKNTGNDQWIDVDLGEQVLVAYRGGRAVFATMVSSGRGMPTPRGNYPVWAKVAATTMANQAYEDNPYMVQGVPWVLLFQGHNALHGAYWHDNFGNRKSHGCVNLAPYDARYVFEWTGPTLPHGWTGYLPSDLQRSVVVHVRDSSAATEFVQDRPIGPPDREAESARADEAELRRAASAIDRAPQYDPAFVPGGVVLEPEDAALLEPANGGA